MIHKILDIIFSIRAQTYAKKLPNARQIVIQNQEQKLPYSFASLYENYRLLRSQHC